MNCYCFVTCFSTTRLSKLIIDPATVKMAHLGLPLSLNTMLIGLFFIPVVSLPGDDGFSFMRKSASDFLIFGISASVGEMHSSILVSVQVLRASNPDCFLRL